MARNILHWSAGLTVSAVLAFGCSGTGDAGSDEVEVPAAQTESVSENPIVVLETNRGRIVMRLFPDRSPESVANFLSYVDGGFYTDLTFHRVIPGFMIQAGVAKADLSRRTNPSAVGVKNEADNGLKNLRGTVAMARTSDLHSATTEFFINLVDNEALDYSAPTPRGFGYAVFGEVIEGMDVVDDIASVPTRRHSPRYADLPEEPIIIESATRTTP